MGNVYKSTLSRFYFMHDNPHERKMELHEYIECHEELEL